MKQFFNVEVTFLEESLTLDDTPESEENMASEMNYEKDVFMRC